MGFDVSFFGSGVGIILKFPRSNGHTERIGKI